MCGAGDRPLYEGISQIQERGAWLCAARYIVLLGRLKGRRLEQTGGNRWQGNSHQQGPLGTSVICIIWSPPSSPNTPTPPPPASQVTAITTTITLSGIHILFTNLCQIMRN